MRNRLFVCAILVTLATASSASADWKKRAMWCASELAVTQGGNVVTNLQSHADAHKRYCDSCSSGKDQFDATLACYEGNDEKWAAVRKEITEAGREDLNKFMKPKAASCCNN